MLNIIEQIDASTRWTAELFGGRLLVQGRILSPLEAEAAGLSSNLVASGMLDQKQIQKMIKQKDKIADINFEDPSDEDVSYLMNLMHGFKPEQLLSIEEQQNKIIQQVVRRASQDQGATFEDLHIVLGYEQQSPTQNRLWVGMLSKEDREVILDHALQGHRRAAESLQTFRLAQ